MESWARWIPIWGWLREYNRTQWKGDVVAGLTVTVMLVPQGMAYAMLAGLPPVVGLYASLLPPLVYALFGTSRQLAVGPVALDSMLVAAGVGAIAKTGSTEYIELTVLLALMVGGLQLLMGVARLGSFVNFLSRPVISGFTSAAALMIGLSQLKHLLGVDVARGSSFLENVSKLWQAMGGLHWGTFGMGAVALGLLVVLKRWNRAFPRALLVVIAGTLLVWALGWSEQGVRVVGSVPAGLPSFQFPSWSWQRMQALFPTALLLALVGFLEAISVAKTFAKRHRYIVDANQDLLAIGLSNLAGSLVQGYPVTGGFSRSAVNEQAGAKTGVASIITALLIGVVLLFLTPLFAYLPKAVLAAIVLAAVSGLFDWREAVTLWRVKRLDALLLGVTFVATLGLGIEYGIGLGVLASLGLFVFQTARPHTAELGRLPGTDVYRNVKRFPEAEVFEQVAIFRIDASFYFANVAFFRDQIDRLLVSREEKLRAVIVDASGINSIDSTADTALHEIARELREAGIALYLASVKGPVRDVFRRSGLYDVMGWESFPFDVNEALAHCVASSPENTKVCASDEAQKRAQAEALDALPQNQREWSELASHR